MYSAPQSLANGDLTIAASVLGPADGSQFNGVTGGTVRIDESTRHTYFISGAAPNSEYSFSRTETIGISPWPLAPSSFAGDETLTTDAMVNSPLLIHDHDKTYLEFCPEGISQYYAEATTSAAVDPDFQITIVPDSPVHGTTAFAIYGEG